MPRVQQATQADQAAADTQALLLGAMQAAQPSEKEEGEAMSDESHDAPTGDSTIPTQRFEAGKRYLWEQDSELYCVGFSPAGNAVMVFTEEYGKERGFVIESWHLETYEFGPAAADQFDMASPKTIEDLLNESGAVYDGQTWTKVSKAVLEAIAALRSKSSKAELSQAT